MNRINKKILEDIDILSKSMEKNNLCEVKFSDESVSYELKKQPKHQVTSYSDISTIEKKPSIEKEVNLTENALKSPMVGTAYLSPEPKANTFIKKGDKVNKGQTLLIIEAMKVMNNINAPKDGIIVDVLIEDSQPVEYDQPIIIIK